MFDDVYSQDEHTMGYRKVHYNPRKYKKRVREGKTQPSVESLMCKDFSTVYPDTPLHDVVKTLIERKVQDIPVVMVERGTRKLLGFISEHDCVDYFSNEIFYSNPDITAKSVSKFKKTTQVITPDTDIFTAASLMVYHDYRYMPIFKSKKLSGILGRQYLLKGLYEYRQYIQSADMGDRNSPDIHQIANHRFIVNN